MGVGVFYVGVGLASLLVGMAMERGWVLFKTGFGSSARVSRHMQPAVCMPLVTSQDEREGTPERLMASFSMSSAWLWGEVTKRSPLPVYLFCAGGWGVHPIFAKPFLN